MSNAVRLPCAELNRVATEVGCDPATVRRALAGKPMRSTTAARLLPVLARLGVTLPQRQHDPVQPTEARDVAPSAEEPGR